MVTESEVELHVQCFSQRMEKVGDEFGATVRSDMFQNAVFGEHCLTNSIARSSEVQWMVVGMNMPCLES